MTLIGAPVKTDVGWGVVRGCSKAGVCLVELDWVLASGSHAVAFVRQERLLQAPAAAPGTPVATPLGSGVLIAYRRDGVHVVRLWAPRGADGSSLAYLRDPTQIRPLAAARNLAVTTPMGPGVVVAVRPAEAAPFVVRLAFGTAYLSSESVKCPVAKVMPLVERAADHHAALAAGAKVEQSARALLASLNNTDAQQLLQGVIGSSGGGGSDDVVASLADEAEYLAAHPEEAKARLAAATGQASAETSRVLALLRDKKAALDAIIAGADASRRGDGSGGSGAGSPIGSPTPLRAARSLVESLLGRREALLDGPALKTHIQSLQALCASDPAVAAAAGDLCSGAACALQLQQQMEASKAAAVLRDGRGRLEKQLKRLAEDWGGNADTVLARRRVEGLLQRLAADDSPALGKSREVLELAAEKLRRRASAAGGGGAAAAEGVRAAGAAGQRVGQRMAAAAAAVAARPQDALRLLHGAGGGVLGVAESSGGSLGSLDTVPSGALLRLTEQLVLAMLQSTPAPPPYSVMQQGGGEYRPIPAPATALEAYSAMDLVDRFESGKLVAELAAHLLCRAGDSATDAIRRSLGGERGNKARALLKELAAAGSGGGGGGGPAAKALQQLLAGASADGSGDIDLEQLVSRTAALLDSDEGAAVAASLVDDAEKGLSGLRAAGAGLGRSPAMQILMKRLADPALEKRLLAGIEGVDAAALVDGAERAVGSREERNKLLDRVKDATVDFLLEHLPALEVPPISGSSGSVRYSVTNLDMSGFKLRKEDVKLVLRDVEGSTVLGPPENAENDVEVEAGKIQTVAVAGGANGSGIDGGVAGASGAPEEEKSSFSHGNGGSSTASGSRVAADSAAPAAVGSNGTTANLSDLQPQLQVQAPKPTYNGAASALPPASAPRRASDVGPGSAAARRRSPPPAAAAAPDGNKKAAASRSPSPRGIAAAVVSRRRNSASPPLPPPTAAAAAGEIFTIVASGIGAEFLGLRWACRQERFPYGGSNGTADAVVVNGSVRLGFAVKRGRLSATDKAEGPVLVLSSKRVAMERLDLQVGESSLAWLVNLLASLFAVTIRQYVERSLVEAMEAHASELLGAVNGFARDSWPLLLSLAKVELASLPPATPAELRQAGGGLAPPKVAPYEKPLAISRHRSFVLGPPAPLPPQAASDAAAAPPPLKPHDFELFFEAPGPLGMQVDSVRGVKNGGVTGTSVATSRLMVLGAFPGGQAEKLLAAAAAAAAANKAAAPLPLTGAEIVRIGDVELATLQGVEPLEVLKAAPRPLRLTFRQWRPDTTAVTAPVTAATACVTEVTGAEAAKAPAGGSPPPSPPPRLPTPQGLLTVRFTQRVLGIRLRPSAAIGPRAVEVSGFARGGGGGGGGSSDSSGGSGSSGGSSGSGVGGASTGAAGAAAAAAAARDETEIGAAEASGVVKPGMVVYSVNGSRLLGLPFETAAARLSTLGRPVELTFLPGCDQLVTLAAPPDDLRLRLTQGHIFVTSLAPVRSKLQAEGYVAVGDTVVAVNGLPLPTDRGFARDVNMLATPGMYPLRLTLRRAAGVPPPPPQPAAKAAAKAAAAAAAAAATTLLAMGDGGNGGPPPVHEVVVKAPGDLCATFEPDRRGAPVVAAIAGVPGPATRSGLVVPGTALVAINGVTVAQEAATVAACWRLLGEAKYPCTLLFRDLRRWAELAALLEDCVAN